MSNHTLSSIYVIMILFYISSLSNAYEKCKEGKEGDWLFKHKECWSSCHSSGSTEDPCKPYGRSKSSNTPKSKPPKCGFKTRTLCSTARGYTFNGKTLDIPYQPLEEHGGNDNKGEACNAEVCTNGYLIRKKGETCRTESLKKGKESEGLDVTHSRKCPEGTQIIAIAACSEFTVGTYNEEYVCQVTVDVVAFVETSDPFDFSGTFSGYYLVKDGQATTRWELDGTQKKGEVDEEMKQKEQDILDDVSSAYNVFMDFNNEYDEGVYDDDYGHYDDAGYNILDQVWNQQDMDGHYDEYNMDEYYEDAAANDDEFDEVENMRIIKNDLRDARLRLETQIRQKRNKKRNNFIDRFY